MKHSKGLTWKAVQTLAAELPGVEVSTSYGTEALKARGKLMVRLKEDNESLVLRVSFDVKEHLLATKPSMFFTTDHYNGYPAILVRLATVDTVLLQQLLEDAWRAAVPKRIAQAYDATR